MTASKTQTSTPTSIATARKSRATRSADRNEAAAQTTPTPTPAAAPAPSPEPQPKINLGARQTTTWVPVVTTADGRTLTCNHDRYGHETEASARKCVTRMINLDRATSTS